MTSGIELPTFRFVAECPNQLRYRVPPVFRHIFISILTNVLLYFLCPVRSPYNSVTLFYSKDMKVTQILHCVPGHHMSMLLTWKIHVFKFQSLHFLYLFERLKGKLKKYMTIRNDTDLSKACSIRWIWLINLYSLIFIFLFVQNTVTKFTFY
jgi:hypothetical protein